MLNGDEFLDFMRRVDEAETWDWIDVGDGF